MLKRTVWKFTCPIKDEFGLVMPKGAQIVHVDVQYDVPTLWTLVDPGAEAESRHFRLAGTGHEIAIRDGDELVHLGSFLMANGTLVFHLFEFVPIKF